MGAIAVLFADGFEEIEAIAIVDVLRRAEFDVKMAGISGTTCTGAHGVQIQMDTTLAEVSAEDLDAVVLPGGLPGATNLRDCDGVITLLKAAADAGKITAAICAAPICLEKAGLLEGKSYTCYPSFESQCESGTYTANRTETDGLIITGRGPGAAIEFGLALTTALGKADTAAALKEGMIVK